jgi:pimeloyl-ACP methyl ester carboxylesterase
MTGALVERTTVTLANGAVHEAWAAGPEGGELVLLLHGFPETAFEWRAQVPALAAAGYRAVAPDQRGYTAGARYDDLAEYHVDHLATDVARFADALGAERFHVVGHDWGGFVAWYAAGRFPMRVRTLTVVSTPHPGAFVAAYHGDTDQRERSAYMDWFRTPDAETAFLADDAAMLRAAYQGHSGEGADEYARVFSADGGAALTGGLNWYRANDFTDGTGPITVPTLYVWSDDDVALGRDAAEATGSFVEGPYRFEVLPGISHWVPEEAPEALNRLILDHLTQG